MKDWTFVVQGRQKVREARLALEKGHTAKEMCRAKANASIVRSSAEVSAKVGDLVMVHETDCTLRLEGKRRKLPHESDTGPRGVTEVLMTGSGVGVVMHGREVRTRKVTISQVKPSHVRPPHLRHQKAASSLSTCGNQMGDPPTYLT